MTDTIRATGGCLCGAVRFEISGPMRDLIACHCNQCRRQTGHYFVATATRRAHLAFTSENGLTWYRSSAQAKRGFCRMCGSTLFWSANDSERINIAAGALDTPTGMRIAKQIYIEHKSDYYDIPPDAPAIEGEDHDVAMPED